MSVERLPITPPTSEEGASLAACRLSLIRGVEILGEVTTRSTEEQVYTSLENANDVLLNFARQAQEAQPKDCSRCLEGAGISCPGKTEQAQEQYGLLSLRGLTPIAARRLIKVAKEGGTLTNPLNRILTLELQEKGYYQEIGDLPPPIVKEALGAVVVVDPRPPDRREEELLEEFREQRPHCATLFATSIEKRSTALSKWRKRNRKSGLKPEEQTKPNLNDARKSYLEALDHTENATEEDHARCLGPNCPLLNGVLWEDFIELTDQIQKEEGIDGNDKKFKTLPRILNILKGLPWNKLISPPDPQTLRSHINDQLVKLAKGHRQDI